MFKVKLYERVRKALSKKEGFTLLELVVVVAIIAILALGIAPIALQQIDKARISKLVSDVDSMQTAVAMFNADVRTYPVALDDLVDGDNNGTPYAGFNGPYINKVPTQHGFGAYEYVKDANGNPMLTIKLDLANQETKQKIWEALGGTGEFTGTDIVVNLINGQVSAK